ncbi:hypothetical protein [Ammoniphilus sp. 3BR4]|uniref:hypothetical protein n=1 Tax=Ammoniphilus sp. 3BR4 TaxID=3158265 RepID=UPI0034650A5C
MGVITAILAISIMIAFFEVPLLLKQPTKDIWAFFILLLTGMSLNIALGLHIGIPNPLDWITVIFEPFSKSIYSFL